MIIFHALKSKKVNIIPLEGMKFTTRHREHDGKLTHEGWAVSGDFPDKEHKYTLMFTPEEARQFHEWLGKMLPRLEATNLDEFITDETHEE